MKRNLIIVLIIFLAAVGGFIYFTKDEIRLTRDTSVYKAVPVSSPFFFEFKSLGSVPFSNPAVNELIKSGVESAFFSLLLQSDSLIRISEQLPKSLRNESFILSFDFTGRNQLVPLFIRKVENNNQRRSVESLIKALYPEARHSYDERRYSKYEITRLTEKGNPGNQLFYSFTDGMFFAGTKSIPVEQAVRQLTSKGIMNDPYFVKVNRTVNAQSEVSLYINHAKFPAYLRNLMNDQTVQAQNEFGEKQNMNYRKAVQDFADFASWTEVDFNFEKDYISLGGISAADDSLNHFLSVFKEQQPMHFRADEMLPKNTSFFCSYTFSDKDKFFSRLEDYFMHSDTYYQREKMIKKMESEFRVDLKNALQNIVRDEIIAGTTTIPVNPQNKTGFFIMHTTGATDAEEMLTELLSNYAARTGKTINDFTSGYAVDDELQFTVYCFPYPSLPGVWLGKPFTMIEANYVAFYDNFMVFCNSQKGLQEYLHGMALGATLAKDMRYLRFKQKVSNRANVNVYTDINRVYSYSDQLFSAKITRALKGKEESLRKFWAVNWQVQRQKSIYFNSVFVGFNEKAMEEAQTTWQSTIGNQMDFKPKIVFNHNDPANREIIVQDEQNLLHQVTKDGRIRWSIPLPGNIMSRIHQIDYYKNGKLQYLFNTKEKLFVIDRDGNNVAHFPVDLRSPATNGVNVFDYENTRNYRYFIAGEDKKIYAYDYSGRVITGWEFGKTDHPVTTPVKHFRIDRKDYIVFKDKSRIYIQDRRGHTRVETSARFENSRNPLLLNLSKLPKIVATDVKGKVYYIYFNGKYEVNDVGDYSENHFFTSDDLNGDGVTDFVFVDGNRLEVMSENGKKLYDEKFDNPVVHPPHLYHFGTKTQKVGIVEAAANRIYLFDPDGELDSGFPLQGSSEFTIGVLSENSGQLNLVVGSEGGSLYNYTMN
ncbi:MAG: hypothetical protein ACOCVA_06530 [Prolixibacteraceae bacterium]